MPPDSCGEFSFSRKGQLIMSGVSPSNGSALNMAPVSTSILTNGSSSSIHHSPPSQDRLEKWILDVAKVGGATNTNMPVEPTGAKGVCVCV